MRREERYIARPVLSLNTMLHEIAAVTPQVRTVLPGGRFTADTAAAVRSFQNFPAGAHSALALCINACAPQDNGPLATTEAAFPPIPADSSLALDYQAKVAAEGNLSQATAATVIFTIEAVE